MCVHWQTLFWEWPPPLDPWASAQVPGKAREKRKSRVLRLKKISELKSSLQLAYQCT